MGRVRGGIHSRIAARLRRPRPPVDPSKVERVPWARDTNYPTYPKAGWGQTHG